MATNYWLGVLLSLVGVVVSALGQTAQRRSRLEAERSSVVVPPWRRPLWFVGIFSVIASAPLDAVSLLFTPLSTIIVLYALKQPLIAVLAYAMLQEHISRLCALGIASVAWGAAMSLYVAPKQEDFELDDPQDFFTTSITWYLVVSGVVCAILGATVFCGPTKVQNDKYAVRDLVLPLLSGWCFSAEKLFNVGMGRLSEDESWLDLKWIWMPVAMVCLAATVFVLNICGLERMSTHIFGPIGFGFTALITGFQGFLFGEFEGMSPSTIVCWSLGLLGAVVGTALVALGSAGRDEKRVLDSPRCVGEEDGTQLEATFVQDARGAGIS